MPLSHITKFFAIEDAKIAKLTSDPAAGAPVYGTLVDVPGIKGITISGTVDTKRLRGDNQLLDLNSVLTDVTATIRYGKLSLDALPVVLGGTTTDAGVTPSQTASWELTNASRFSYFKLEGTTPENGTDTIGGDGHILLHKCILSGFPEMGFEEEDYKLFEMPIGTVPLLSTGKWIKVVLNETKTAIA